MSRCLVTGATGFVGSHVARALVERGDDVRVTVRAGSPSEPLEGVDAERVKLSDVNPARVFGPGDWGPSSTDVVRRFLLRRIPAYVGGAINIVDVRDVAAGHLLADERGRPGERYILGNRNYTWDRLFAELAHVSGVDPPAVRVPYPVALALAESGARLPGRPPVMPAEVRTAAHWWTYRSTRARRELGWTVRSHEETVEETVRWWMERLGDRVRGTRQPIPLRMAGAASRAFGDLRGWLSP